MKVLRSLGIPAMALAGMLALFTPSSADARVRFGVQIGAPAYPVYANPYPYPYYAYPYVNSYVAPYSTWGYDYHRHYDRHERWEHRHHRR